MSKIILVIGASGSQGGEVLLQLQRDKKFKIRVLQRKESDFSKRMRKEGVEVVIGDLNDEDSLVKATENVYGIFSVLAVSIDIANNKEISQEINLVNAAQKNNVQILIHASVARAGDEQNFKDWNEKDRTPFYHSYWEGKTGANNAIKNSKLPHWVIFKPAWMMDNFLKGRSLILPDLKNGLIDNNVKLDTKLDFICALDQARFVCDAFENIEKYDKKEIDLAAESLTFSEVADIIFKNFNKKIKVVYTERSEMIKRGVPKPIVDSYEWDNIEGYKVDIEKVKSYGVKMTDFNEFCRIYKDRLDI